MEITTAIIRARRFLDPSAPAPISEADTRRRVIDPLLRAAGYEDDDWLSEESGLTGRPDYTMLPGTRATWYIEAKRWGQPCEEREIGKALGYAADHRARWVAVTNGETWTLYDTEYLKRANGSRRKVAEASLHNAPELAAFLEAVSKESVGSGALAEYVGARLQAERWRSIRHELRTRFEKPTPHLIATLHHALTRDPLCPIDITRDEVKALLASAFQPTIEAAGAPPQLAVVSEEEPVRSGAAAAS